MKVDAKAIMRRGGCKKELFLELGWSKRNEKRKEGERKRRRTKRERRLLKRVAGSFST